MLFFMLGRVHPFLWSGPSLLWLFPTPTVRIFSVWILLVILSRLLQLTARLWSDFQLLDRAFKNIMSASVFRRVSPCDVLNLCRYPVLISPCLLRFAWPTEVAKVLNWEEASLQMVAGARLNIFRYSYTAIIWHFELRLQWHHSSGTNGSHGSCGSYKTKCCPQKISSSRYKYQLCLFFMLNKGTGSSSPKALAATKKKSKEDITAVTSSSKYIFVLIFCAFFVSHFSVSALTSFPLKKRSPPKFPPKLPPKLPQSLVLLNRARTMLTYFFSNLFVSLFIS